MIQLLVENPLLLLFGFARLDRLDCGRPLPSLPCLL
jgi:hypothetical protein